MGNPFHRNKVDASATEAQLIQIMMDSLKDIYSNHSSDEYKSHGDITKSSEYHNIEKLVSQLPTLKGFPAGHAREIKQMFETLHRPVFNKMVTEYIAEPNDQNTVFTAFYTTGFRVLVGELARIFASTEATKKGVVYKPDKVSRKRDMYPFIRVFNDSLEKKINEYIKSTGGTSKPQQESYIYQEGDPVSLTTTMNGILGSVMHVMFTIFGAFRDVVKLLNPISLINSTLMVSYNSKVAKFREVSDMYNATKEAYEEYVRIPEAKRSEKVAAKYLQDMEKYNIKMENLKAQIDHYDQRSSAEADEKLKDSKSGSTQQTNGNQSSSDDNTSTNTGSDFDF